MSRLLSLLITIYVGMCMCVIGLNYRDGTTLIFRGDGYRNEENTVQTTVPSIKSIKRLNQVSSPKTKTISSVPIPVSFPNTGEITPVTPVIPDIPVIPVIPVLPVFPILPVVETYEKKKGRKKNPKKKQNTIYSSRKARQEQQIGKQIRTGKVKTFY
eukprot:UN09527